MFSDNSNVNAEILVHCKECIQIGKMTKMYYILYNILKLKSLHFS